MQCRDSNFSILIVDTGQGYQLVKISPMSRLLLLQDKLPLVTRIPLEDEVDFLTERKQLTPLISKRLWHQIKHWWYSIILWNKCETRHAALLTASYLFVEEEGQLLGFDVNQEERNALANTISLRDCIAGLPFRLGRRILKMVVTETTVMGGGGSNKSPWILMEMHTIMRYIT